MTQCYDCPRLTSPGPKRPRCCCDETYDRAKAESVDLIARELERAGRPERLNRAERRRLARLARKGGGA